MASEKIFISCLVTLVLFNIIFNTIGWLNLVSVSSILGIFITIGIIAVIMGFVPLTSGSGTVRWFMATVICVCILYSMSFSILTWDITIGIGLVSNLSNLFSSDPSTLSFMPFLFFNSIGLIGLISGIIASSSGGE